MSATTVQKVGIDVRETRLDEIYEALRIYCCAHKSDLLLLETDADDFIQDCVSNIFQRKGLDTYDETKGRSLQSLIWNIASRQVIDMKRAKFGAKSRNNPETGRPYEHVSLDKSFSNSEGDDFTLAEMVADVPESMSVFTELLELAPVERISPNYDLTWRSLFELSVDMEPHEIGQKVGISASRVAQLQKELFRRFLRP